MCIVRKLATYRRCNVDVLCNITWNNISCELSRLFLSDVTCRLKHWSVGCNVGGFKVLLLFRTWLHCIPAIYAFVLVILDQYFDQKYFFFPVFVSCSWWIECFNFMFSDCWGVSVDSWIKMQKLWLTITTPLLIFVTVLSSVMSFTSLLLLGRQ